MLVDPNGEENLVSFNTSENNEKETRLQNYGENYRRNNGVIHLWSHGNNNGFNYYKNGQQKGVITKTSFEKYLNENSSVYQDNKEKGVTTLIVLHSCKTGQKDGFAQKMSSELDLLIVAPNKNVEVKRGGYETDRESVESGGAWMIYYKGKLMNSFNGETAPLFDNPEKTIKYYEELYQQKYGNETNE